MPTNQQQPHISGRLANFRFETDTLAKSQIPGQGSAFLGLNQSEVLNINILYLETVHALMNQYIIAIYRGNLELALESLQLLSTTMSPKIDTSKEEAGIDNVEKILPRILIRDTDGNIVRYNPDLVRRVKRSMRLIYKSLLVKLDKKGMLTFAPKDYKSVLGDFSKA